VQAAMPNRFYPMPASADLLFLSGTHESSPQFSTSEDPMPETEANIS
jgi:hypothetical protein